MIKFKEHSFVIEIETGGNPIEDWLATHSELVDALQSESEDMMSKRYHYLELLRNLLPDYDTAKALLPDIKNLNKTQN
jgi:hypothetical protein